MILAAYRAGAGGQDLEAARVVLQRLSSRGIDNAVAAFEARLGYNLSDRSCLASHLEDIEALSRCPEGSIGQEFLAWKRSRDVEFAPAASMVSRGKPMPETVGESYERPLQLGKPGDSARHWVIRRWGVAHDLWHIITGFDIDSLGEALLATFSAAACPGDRGNALFGVVSLLTRPWRAKDFLRAYLWGRQARAHLVTAPWETWLSSTPAEIRGFLNMSAPEEMYPRGIPMGAYFPKGAD